MLISEEIVLHTHTGEMAIFGSDGAGDGGGNGG